MSMVTSGLISTAKVMIASVTPCFGRDHSLGRGLPWLFVSPEAKAWDPTYSHIGYRLPSLQIKVFLSMIRHVPYQYLEMNLVENNTLGRSKLLLIWQYCCIIKSAAYYFRHMLSMNLLCNWHIQSRRAWWITPLQVIMTVNSFEMPRKILYIPCDSRVHRDMYPHGYPSSTVDTVKGKPLTSP
jgi:hypothetical protein